MTTDNWFGIDEYRLAFCRRTKSHFLNDFNPPNRNFDAEILKLFLCNLSTFASMNRLAPCTNLKKLSKRVQILTILNLHCRHELPTLGQS